jgi:hypothetical protein
MDKEIRLDAKIDISLGEWSWKGNLGDIVKINIDNLKGEMVRQPEMVSWFGMVAVEALDDVERIKNELAVLKDDQDALYAELDAKIRGAAAATNVKPTEPQIKAAVLRMAEYKEHKQKMAGKREELRAANLTQGKAAKMLIGLEHKRDMLIQLSSNKRKEFSSGDYGHEGSDQ